MKLSNLDETKRCQSIVDNIYAKCVQEGDCLVWTGPRDKKGYGYVYIPGTGTVLVHRAVWINTHGEIPDGYEIDHVKDRGCHSRGCCNERHLEPVTHKVNLMRGVSFSAINALKTHCPKGHQLAGSNLVASELKRGSRKCRTCNNERLKKSWHKRKRARCKGIAVAPEVEMTPELEDVR